MMGEQDRLPDRAEFRQHVERMAGARIVETGEQVIADERQRFGVALGQQGQPQSEKKLVGGAFAHRLEVQPVAIASQAFQDGLVAGIIIDDHTGEGPAGRPREQL